MRIAREATLLLTVAAALGGGVYSCALQQHAIENDRDFAARPFNPGAPDAIVNPMSPQYAGGAKCDGVSDDTAALNAAALATVSGQRTFPSTLLIPNTGKACLTSTGISFNNKALPAVVDVEGTLRASAPQAALISVTSSGAGTFTVPGSIYGPGIIDANGKAQNGIWLHACNQMNLKDFTLNNAPVSGIRMGDSKAGTQCIASIRDVSLIVQDLTIFPTQGVPKTPGSIGIFPDNSTDDHVDNATVIGYDIGIESSGGSSKIMHSHVWGHTNQVPSIGYLGVGGGTLYLDDYADGISQYGFRLLQYNDMLIAPQVYCNASFCPANRVIGIQFEKSGPFASVEGARFIGSAAAPLLQDINVAGGDYTSLSMMGNLSMHTVNVAAQVTQSPQSIKVNGKVFADAHAGPGGQARPQ